jgi:hypothetical protein
MPSTSTHLSLLTETGKGELQTGVPVKQEPLLLLASGTTRGALVQATALCNVSTLLLLLAPVALSDTKTGAVWDQQQQ